LYSKWYSNPELKKEVWFSIQLIPNKNIPIFNTQYLVLNGNKVKYYVPSTIKCIGEIDRFSNTGPPRTSFCVP
jgi:hypothetical protein